MTRNNTVTVAVETDGIMSRLKELAEHAPLVYAPNKGNAGDALILCATLQALADHQVPFTLYRPGQTLDGKVLVCGGGGNLVRYYNDAARFIDRHLAAVRHLVILPHTVEAHEDLLGRFNENVDVFCREPVSYRYVRNAVHGANVILSHDLALSFFPERLDALVRRQVPALPLKPRLKYSLRYLALLRMLTLVKCRRALGNRKRTLRAYRRDQESAGLYDTRENLDLSALLRPGRMSPAAAVLSVRHMMRVINGFDIIETDRLHVMILAALLDKEVRFRGGSYYKNAAVYQHSIKNRFPKVQYVHQSNA